MLTDEDRARLGALWAIGVAELAIEEPSAVVLVVLPDEALQNKYGVALAHLAAERLSTVLGASLVWASSRGLAWTEQNCQVLARQGAVMVVEFGELIILDDRGIIEALHNGRGNKPLVIITSERQAAEVDEYLECVIEDASLTLAPDPPIHRVHVLPAELRPDASPGTYRDAVRARIEALPDREHRRWQAQLGLLLLRKWREPAIIVEWAHQAGKSFVAKALTGILNRPGSRVRYIDRGNAEIAAAIVARSDIVFVETEGETAQIAETILQAQADHNPHCQVVFLAVCHWGRSDRKYVALEDACLRFHWSCGVVNPESASNLPASLQKSTSNPPAIHQQSTSNSPANHQQSASNPTGLSGLLGAALAAAVRAQLEVALPTLSWSVDVAEGADEGSASGVADCDETPWSAIVGFTAESGISLSFNAAGVELEGEGLTAADAVIDADRNLRGLRDLLADSPPFDQAGPRFDWPSASTNDTGKCPNPACGAPPAGDGFDCYADCDQEGS